MKKQAIVVAVVACIATVLANQGCTATPGIGPSTAAVGRWTEIDPSGDVPPCVLPAMVYDSGSGKLILCGEVAPIFMNTWVFDPATKAWALVAEGGGSLSSRAGHVLAFDSSSQRVLLFGGKESIGPFLNDTWAYDPVTSTWTKLEPAGDLPPARAYHSMVCDPGTGRLILFGGFATAGAGGGPFHFFGDTWAYDPAANAWTDLHPAGEVPSPRTGSAMVFDPGTGKVVLFGGNGFDGDYGDTWAYDPAANTWTELEPAGELPPARYGHCMVCDPRSGRLLLFGGDAAILGAFNDTWAYDPAANTWTELEPAGDLPPARSSHFMFYDPPSSTVMLLGGWDNNSAPLFDVWFYDGLET